MSDKVREFVEIPQQFLKEGNQVSRPPPAFVETWLTIRWHYSSSPAAQSLHKRVRGRKIILQLQTRGLLS